MNFPEYLSQQQNRINTTLINFLPALSAPPKRLHEAMHYAVLNGGKRIRPLLVYATGELFAAPVNLLDRAACAVELIHCYSLVHDDLPAMDNDDLRRGKATCHKAFDEATAILAGDALQSLAFAILADGHEHKNISATQLKMLHVLTEACGSNGMAGGQTLDLQATGNALNLIELENLHRLKTGALIRASVKLGALAGHAETEELTILDKFSAEIGLAFQIQDDILDIEVSTEILGKQQGADVALAKPTFPALLGMSAAKNYLQETYQKALNYLSMINKPTDNLRHLAKYIVERTY